MRPSGAIGTPPHYVSFIHMDLELVLAKALSNSFVENINSKIRCVVPIGDNSKRSRNVKICSRIVIKSRNMQDGVPHCRRQLSRKSKKIVQKIPHYLRQPSKKSPALSKKLSKKPRIILDIGQCGYFWTMRDTLGHFGTIGQCGTIGNCGTL